MMKLAVFMMAVAIAATTVLPALKTLSEHPMRTRIIKKVSDTPPASSKGAKLGLVTLGWCSAHTSGPWS